MELELMIKKSPINGSLKIRRVPKTCSEHTLQSQCIEWFRLQYPSLLKHLFAVPNARKCDYKTANYLRKEGVLSGVADCFLAVPCGDLHGVFIEFKVGNNKQTVNQRDFEIAMISLNYQYWIIKDFDNFINSINNYLK